MLSGIVYNEERQSVRYNLWIVVSVDMLKLLVEQMTEADIVMKWHYEIEK